MYNKPKLTVDEATMLTALRRRAEVLDKRIINRDPQREEALRQNYGERYRDYEQQESESLWWAIHFIEENSIREIVN